MNEGERNQQVSDENLPPREGRFGGRDPVRRESLSDDEEIMHANETVHQPAGAAHHNHFHHYAHSHLLDDNGADLSDLSAHRAQDQNSGGAGDSSDSDNMMTELAIANMLQNQNKWRAKLYQLNTKGQWDDFGTGEFSIVKDVSHQLIL